MKRYSLIFYAVFAFGVTSCINNSTNEKAPEEGLVVTDTIIEKKMEVEKEFPQTSCYRYESSRDTIYLKMERTEVEDEVTGTLSYNYMEQPKSSGSFKGKIVGDTVFADYTYKLNGNTDTREVIFIKKDSSIVEGFGETRKIKGKTKFKPDAIMSFNEALSLEQISCPQDQ